MIRRVFLTRVYAENKSDNILCTEEVQQKVCHGNKWIGYRSFHESGLVILILIVLLHLLPNYALVIALVLVI
ncbi:hypothetical protein D3C73_1558370 [compost metagenome]